jgi:hypothetical protein
VNTFFRTEVPAVTRRLLKRSRMKTRDKRRTRKSSCCSRGGVSTRSFKRIVTHHPAQVVIFTFHEFEFPFTKLFACAISLDKVVGIFEKISKKRGGTRASCPW